MAITITDTEKNILQNVTIPPRPEALIRISDEGKKAEPNVTVIADAISEDVSIASAVLQLVNSAAFRRGSEIESIHKAVMTLGFKRLLPLVKAVALSSSMGESERLATFWEKASLVATSASLAAVALKKPALKDQAYMLGLFHNAGVPIMLLEFDNYAEVIAQADQDGWHNIGEKEFSLYQTTHTTVSAVLGQKWKLPSVMNEVIYYLHDVEGLFTSGEFSDLGLDLMSILKLARFVAYCKEYDVSESEEWNAIEDQVLERYSLSEEDIDELRERLLEELNEQ